MISKNTFTVIANTIANNLNREYCMTLDTKLEKSLREAFKDERISEARQHRIVNKFCDTLLGKEQ